MYLLQRYIRKIDSESVAMSLSRVALKRWEQNRLRSMQVSWSKLFILYGKQLKAESVPFILKVYWIMLLNVMRHDCGR